MQTGPPIENTISDVPFPEPGQPEISEASHHHTRPPNRPATAKRQAFAKFAPAAKPSLEKRCKSCYSKAESIMPSAASISDWAWAEVSLPAFRKALT